MSDDRDFIGYGADPPDPKWPGEARIAVNINLNFEGGGERSILEGDAASEGALNDIGQPSLPGLRSPLVESVFEYGSRVGGWRHLVIPYSFETNDNRFDQNRGFSTGDDFARYMIDCFETLYAEGADRPKLMSLALHDRLIGRPGRIIGLVKFLDHIAGRDRVWICTGRDIAEHWRRVHPG